MFQPLFPSFTEAPGGARSRLGAVVLLLLGAGLFAPLPAQEAVLHEIPRDLPGASPFQLGGIGDFGRVGLRSTGNVSGFCVSNAAGLNSPRGAGCSEPRIFNAPQSATGTTFAYFEMPFVIAAPPSDLPEGVDPSGLVGDGYTFNMNATLPSRREELLASDRSGRDLLNLGVTATSDGSCRDFTGLVNGNVFAGQQLLPHNQCPATWPTAATEWPGRKRISLENFVAAQSIINPTGDDDPFAFWRVPDELTTGSALGDEATFGEFNDFSADLLRRYPQAVPGGEGATPTLSGWPLGLTIQFDAFYFTLPGINNGYFLQYVIINDSEQVWGQPVDYDSIYVATIRSPGNDQFQTFNVDLSRGVWFTSRCNYSNTPNAKPNPWSNCPGNTRKDGLGIQGFMVLKSPLGDMRNKLLSDPTSPFYNPTHPAVDDTITFNHSHGCTFITCTDETYQYSERAGFGVISSTLENLLDGRPQSYDAFANGAAAYFNIVHPSEVWPTPGDFNKYVPGDWDYNEDGVPDTIYIDQCGSRGCVPAWHDTVPGGYVNRSGQVGPLSVGPFALAAGDTSSLIIVYLADRDSASFETTKEAIYDLYMNFFLVPEPATPPNVIAQALSITGGASGADADSAEVRINWNDRTRNFVDAFLSKRANDIESAEPNSADGKLRALNPWLVDSLRARAAANVEAIYVFRSCDGGTTFTDDDDCFGDQVAAADQTSKWAPFGWLPWATLAPDVTSITDDDVMAGITYFYSVVTETRGAEFQVLVDEGAGPLPDVGGQPVCDPTRCGPQVVEFAPKILSPLAKTADAASVASAYVPLSRQAGVAPAQANLTSPLGAALVPVDVNLTAGARAGQYRGVFADTVLLTTTVTARDAGGQLDTLSVAAVAETNTGQSFSADAPVTLRGEELVSEETRPGPQPDVSIIETVHRIVGENGAALVLLDVGANQKPLLITGALEPDRTTPGAFIDRPDFPGFILDVDAAEGGQLDEQFYSVPGQEVVPDGVTNGATVEWLDSESEGLVDEAFSVYRVEWADRPYGPGEPFARGADLPQRFSTSMQSRATAGTSLADTATLRKVGELLGEDAPESLTAYSLPFTITNVTENRPVQVAVVSHADEILLGPGGADTTRVALPAGAWGPGDRLVLFEQIGGELVATWDMILGCSSGVGANGATGPCNALAGSDYVPIAQNGARLNVTYFRPVAAGVEFSFDVLPRRAAPELARGDLGRIQVVPNPYVFFSEFERAPGRSVIKFTNVPPEGQIRIYTVAGQFVQQITWTEENLNGNGDLEWDLISRENTQVAYGLYIWVLDSPTGQARGKFVVIR